MTTMTNIQAREHLHAFVDDELDAATRSAVADALGQFPELAEEETELHALRALTRDAFMDDHVAQVNLDGIFDGVMARVAADAKGEAPAPAVKSTRAVVASSEDTFSLGAWLKGLFTFERPMVSMAFAAAMAALIGFVGWSNMAPATPGGSIAPAPVIANGDPSEKPRRGMEFEGRTAGSVVDHKIAEGTFRVEFENDPDTPMVMWHEGTDTDAKGGQNPTATPEPEGEKGL